jgi:hypothetical protein
LKHRTGLVPRWAMQFVGHVVLSNKFNNEFNEIQAPQEIAGFFYAFSIGELS